ncbi:MAG: hypothetical protein RQ842_02115 [Vulcanisaeta sp.]|nr:hypothetical protein [Vulcanisaeta sp.]
MVEVRVKVHSRGLHGGSLYSYEIPLHRVMLDIMDDVDEALSDVDFEMQVECDEDDEECINGAYDELGLEQSRAVGETEEVLNRWSKKVQLPFILSYVNACDEYDACYYDIYLASIADLFRWWDAPIDRDVIIDALVTEYQFSISDADGLVFFDPKVRTSIHAIEVPSDVLKPLWYRGDLDRAIDVVRKILLEASLGIPEDPDKEVVYEDEVEIA